ncbi:PilN domain-containing protein [Candidatus Azambacteria bacterium]|nr:PilN domain-containing protein [Candidatus Azambacteria bacterium]MBI2587799.1 PilN domain-containing protein [Candidatus Azambacteria bacterium]
MNLLPPIERERLEAIRNRRLVLFLGRALFVSLLFFAGLLFAMFLFLSIQERSLAERLEIERQSFESQKLREIEQKVEKLMASLRTTDQLLRREIPWSEILARVADELPPGARLTTLTANASGEVKLTGQADRRETVLEFERSLKSDPAYASVEAPLANVLKPTDILFSFTLKVKALP